MACFLLLAIAHHSIVFKRRCIWPVGSLAVIAIGRIWWLYKSTRQFGLSDQSLQSTPMKLNVAAANNLLLSAHIAEINERNQRNRRLSEESKQTDKIIHFTLVNILQKVLCSLKTGYGLTMLITWQLPRE